MSGKIDIWSSSIPYNTGASKFDELELKNKNPSEVLAVLKLLPVLKESKYSQKRRHRVHELTYAHEIKHGSNGETYSDVPRLIPYLVPGSDRCILVVPGGGYMLKSDQLEGEGIARSLNEEGISAFVLEYRLNPYKAPVPFLDLQRAIRYVRFHAHKYGIHPDKIGAIGFSAGGHMIAAVMTMLRNAPVLYEGYEEDDIDRTDDRLALAGLIYPLLNCTNFPLIAISLFHREDAENEEKRAELLEHYSVAQYVKADDPPHFLCYGDNDMLLKPEGILEYRQKLDEHGVPNKLLRLEGANHGFGDCEGDNLFEKLASPGRYAFWKKEFADWANGVFDGSEETTV
ncbi:alpha/beta hydrolase [Saccharibacillus kuerlensis]|uniref:BD-FAE-like domain-containing protein n=1 Tax=Saccharibacillus kuerlensis TaxID=459527 RepID=A0ABQ2L4J3_9BACL|nr:alpha/beta hydrolase [Saccharibacillus kuerlensis]GGO01837.1 hypothetical protein GCM10010969_24520 [Saccharibacillus kuerlensis]